FHLARNGRSFLIYFALLAIKLLSGVSFCKNLHRNHIISRIKNKRQPII
ncbi:hypothetical protein AAKU61_002559, partial [Undibacterium sp. GrIS 1.2]